MITIHQIGDGDPLEFEAVIEEPNGTSRHRVTLTRAEAARLGGGAAPERLVQAAFQFLLEREPKEAILARFELKTIARYFPEFERELPKYLKG
ncbi:MAG: hypothetical protein JO107_16010 [Hyphomicrobiales bacterium]|nr:hypothetical protein [Hyphomicrobiales bacterium]MBV8664594.1 hypothetical protein [Hyphomicrobiales bacterium]